MTTPYEPQTWADEREGGTALTADRLNHIEGGVATADERALAARALAEGRATPAAVTAVADALAGEVAAREAALTRTALEPVLYDPGPPVWELQPGSDVMATTIDGLGPIAITDENVGGVIGDIAYVVSGYVYNPEDAARLARPGVLGVIGHTYQPGETFLSAAGLSWAPLGGLPATLSGWDSDGNPYSLDGAVGQDSLYYWPYLERYDLANKMWLSRIELPTVALPSPTTFAGEGTIGGVIDGKLYFGGGDGIAALSGQEFFVYDPATESFERLPDIPYFSGYSYTADYNPFGVVGGKLYIFLRVGNNLGDAGLPSPGLVYDPVTSSWSSFTHADAETIGGGLWDQVQGFEIGGKLYFAYDYVYVFDPVALTGEVKAVCPVDALPGAYYLSDGKLHAVGPARLGGTGDFVYDHLTDVWSDTGAYASPDTGYSVAGTYQGVGYVFSGMRDGVRALPGVYGLTGVEYADTPSVLRTAKDSWRTFNSNRLRGASWTFMILHSAAQGNPFHVESIDYNSPLQIPPTVQVNLPPTSLIAGNRIFMQFWCDDGLSGLPDLTMTGKLTVSRVDGAAWAEIGLGTIWNGVWGTHIPSARYESVPVSIATQYGDQVELRPDGYSVNVLASGVWTAQVELRVALNNAPLNSN